MWNRFVAGVTTLFECVCVVAVVVAIGYGLVWASHHGYITIDPSHKAAGQLADNTPDAAPKADRLAVVVKDAVQGAMKEHDDIVLPQIASVEKKVKEVADDFTAKFGELKTAIDEANKNATFARNDAAATRDDMTKLNRAALAANESPKSTETKTPSAETPPATDPVSLENWKILNVGSRSQLFTDKCQGKVKWNSVDAELYQAGLAHVSQSDAETIINNCDVNAVIAKAPKTTTAETEKDSDVPPAPAVDRQAAGSNAPQPEQVGYYPGRGLAGRRPACRQTPVGCVGQPVTDQRALTAAYGRPQLAPGQCTPGRIREEHRPGGTDRWGNPTREHIVKYMDVCPGQAARQAY